MVQFPTTTADRSAGRVSSRHTCRVPTFATCAGVGLIWIFVGCITAGTIATPSQAQYFGRNKVQYEDFDFSVLHTEHFKIYYYSEAEDAARIAAELAERWYARLARVFQHELEGKQPLLLYASHPDFQQTNAISGIPGEGTGGVTESLKRRVILPLPGPLSEMDHVIGHELVHAFQYDMTGAAGPSMGAPAISRFPLWFIEGAAEYLSIGARSPQTAMWLRDAIASEEVGLPSYEDLDSPDYFPYRYGHAVLAYVAGNYGETAIATILDAAGKRQTLAHGFQEGLGVDPDSLVERWAEALRGLEAFSGGGVPADTAAGRPSPGPPAGPDPGTVLASEEKNGGEINIGPALSPDGTRLAFFSERNEISLSLFIADAKTGEVTETVIRRAVDPHFESLFSLRSSAAWGPEGRRLAVAGTSQGRAVLTIYDADSGDIERNISMAPIDEIQNPTWSPDGRRVAVSGLDRGFVDLFVLDLESGRSRKLTDDRFADIHPAWSPDGSRIAFATDRFTTDFTVPEAGEYRLALLDVDSEEVRALPHFDWGQHIDPQWTPDGRSLCFLSDQNGVPNVYRLGLESGRLEQLTNVFTGISGVTPSSPALSVASRSGAGAISIFRDGGYVIRRVDGMATQRGTRVAARSDQDIAETITLPPQDDRRDVAFLQLLEDEQLGVESATDADVTDYSPSLSLDYIGQPYVAAGASSVGSFFGGGGALVFSDMLGNHNLAVAVDGQFGGRVSQFAALASYLNRSNRLNWGGALSRSPYLSGFFESGQGEDSEGDPIFIERETLFEQVDHQVTGILSYPFSRTQRIDATLGFRWISFDRNQRTRVFDQFGRLISEETEDLSSPSGLGLAEGNLALVEDQAVYGAITPILGHRFRLEAAPTLGSLNYYSLRADLRNYLSPIKPFTLAGRLYHHGRYGGDARDSRLSELFLGYLGLVRGYGIGLLGDGCGEFAFEDCDGVDQLTGSRILVGNVELRVPPLGLLGLGSGYYGAFPIEIGAFGDAGVAWTDSSEPELWGGERELVTSVGFLGRVNLFGYTILEVDFVRPQDRRHKGWHWQFGFSTGL